MYQHFRWIDGIFFFQTQSLKMGLCNSPFNVCNTYWISGIANASTVLMITTVYWLHISSVTFHEFRCINSFIIALTTLLFGTFINHILQLRKLKLQDIGNFLKSHNSSVVLSWVKLMKLGSRAWGPDVFVIPSYMYASLHCVIYTHTYIYKL